MKLIQKKNVKKRASIAKKKAKKTTVKPGEVIWVDFEFNFDEIDPPPNNKPLDPDFEKSGG